LKSVQGTSYAAGVAAGAAAAVLGYFQGGYYPEGFYGGNINQYVSPTADILKAVLINSGQPLKLLDTNGNGQYISLNEFPSGYQGFGRIQLDQTLFTNSSDRNKQLSVNTGSLSVGDSVRFCYSIVADTNPFIKATLVWIDAPATSASAHILVNDLDLVIVDENSTEYRTDTSADGSFDSFNNVEQVYLPGSFNSNFAVYVYARSVPSGPEQNFALVVMGNAVGVPCYSFASGVCPNQCSGHGACNATGYCICESGFEGVDCSLTPCPTKTTAICSGYGYCDYQTASCVCSGNHAPPDCNGVLPPATNSSSTPVTVTQVNSPYTKGLLAGTVVAAFFVGAIISVVIGGFGAVKYLEYRRDKAAKERAMGEEEMN